MTALCLAVFGAALAGVIAGAALTLWLLAVLTKPIQERAPSDTARA